jgi:predicted Rossmann-fold nucleotide-binding protein
MSGEQHSRKGDEIVVSPSVNVTALVESFMKEYGLHRIVAFSGGSDDRPEGISDSALEAALTEVLRQKEQHIIAQAVRRLQGYRIAILGGGTKWGVPHTAALEARKVGLATIGVYPFAGKKHALSGDVLDLRICIEPEFGESRWGDESSVYAKLLDGMVVYGGGAGTLVEVAHVLKMNEAILERNETAKLIVPISGSGGVADGLPFIWGKSRVRSVSIPQEKVASGLRAAELLIERLNLDDFTDL